MTPENMRYSKDHVWVRPEGGRVLIGITDHAQRQLGDITFVEIPSVGKRVERRESLAVIESVKAAGEALSPVAGKVVGTNADLVRHPELINDDPCGKGWLCALADVKQSDISDLMDAAEYERHIQDR